MATGGSSGSCQSRLTPSPSGCGRCAASRRCSPRPKRPGVTGPYRPAAWTPSPASRAGARSRTRSPRSTSSPIDRADLPFASASRCGTMPAVTDVLDGVLAGFDRAELVHDGITHHYYRAGYGPAVIVIHEIPVMHPGVVAFARRVIDDGFTTYLPSLFGQDGRELSGGYSMVSLWRACVSREFTGFAAGRTSPVVAWLRALAANAHEECGGPGVGAVGMCFTGGFALAMMVDERMLAPVLSQPSLPFAITRRQKAAVGVSPADLARVKQRTADGACLLGLRFTGDSFVPAERFETLRRELGDAFVAVEIDSSPGNPHGIPKDAHSVLTHHLVDEPGHPTRVALDQVLTLFRTRLAQAPDATPDHAPDPDPVP